jgi:hypothetical protein
MEGDAAVDMPNVTDIMEESQSNIYKNPPEIRKSEKRLTRHARGHFFRQFHKLLHDVDPGNGQMPARKIRFVGFVGFGGFGGFVGFGRFVCFGAFVLFGFGVVRWGGHGGTGRGTVGAGGRVVPGSADGFVLRLEHKNGGRSIQRSLKKKKKVPRKKKYTLNQSTWALNRAKVLGQKKQKNTYARRGWTEFFLPRLEPLDLEKACVSA